MAPGETSLNNAVGSDIVDSFYDSYKSEALACGDIIGLVGSCDAPQITVTFDISFLRKIVHSHLLYIRKLEK